jgi:hypothetical protein
VGVTGQGETVLGIVGEKEVDCLFNLCGTELGRSVVKGLRGPLSGRNTSAGFLSAGLLNLGGSVEGVPNLL